MPGVNHSWCQICLCDPMYGPHLLVSLNGTRVQHFLEVPLQLEADNKQTIGNTAGGRGAQPVGRQHRHQLLRLALLSLLLVIRSHVSSSLMQEGVVRSQWAGRSVISSAGQLAYGHAQAVIDGAAPPESPANLHGGHSWEQVRMLLPL